MFYLFIFFFFFFSFLTLDFSIDANRGFSLKKKNRMANSVDPDETVFAKLSVLVCREEMLKGHIRILLF